LRPDLSFLSELRLSLDPALDCPNQVGPLLCGLALEIGDHPRDLISLGDQSTDDVSFRHGRIALPSNLSNSRMPGIKAGQ
jgi:hypothetical protein